MEFVKFPNHTECPRLLPPELIHIQHYNERLMVSSCSNAGAAIITPCQYRPFFTLLNLLNLEISEVDEGREGDKYWVCLRSYLNNLATRTIHDLKDKKEPRDLSHWLLREFMMVRHDPLSQNKYSFLMRNRGWQPYGIDVFTLGVHWFTSAIKNMNKNNKYVLTRFRLEKMVRYVLPQALLQPSEIPNVFTGCYQLPS